MHHMKNKNNMLYNFIDADMLVKHKKTCYEIT